MRLFVIALLVAGLTFAATTAALAQAPPGGPGVAADPGSTNTADPGQTCSDTIGATQGTGCDSELAPVAKDSALWTQIGGQIFGTQGRLSPGSPTPISSDLFAVSFYDNRNGFAGGTTCADPALLDQSLDACPADRRMPVMYQYREVGGTGGVWEQAQLPASDRPGFVGAIAWIGPGRALAVGGTGSYPRREDEIPGDAGCLSGSAVSAADPGRATPTGISACEGAWRSDHDPAGKARAWLFDGGRWCELGPGSTCGELPALDLGDGGSEPMRALTALDCTPRPQTDGELCFAGGLQQLWEWRDGSFTRGWSPSSVDDQGNPLVDRAPEWRFRVRALRFMPGADLPPTQVVATTAGCCSELPSQNNPRLLVFDGHQWAVRLIYDNNPGQLTQEQTQTIPDSLYSLMTEHSGPAYYAGLIATPGGPGSHYPASEPASRVLGDVLVPTTGGPGVGAGLISVGPLGDALGAVEGPFNGSDSDVPREAANPLLASMRLLAGDGDVAGPPGAPNGAGTDQMMDWAVGVLRSSGQAIAYNTTTKLAGLGALLVNPLDCPGGGVSTANADKCTPASGDEVQGQTRSSTLFKLGSFGLNAFQMVPGQTGTGWAVGDRGAIERLGGAGASGARTEGPPPKLGNPTPAPLPADTAYDEARSGADPSSNTVGTVPAQDSAPMMHLPRPEVVSAGSPDTSRSAFRPVQGVNSIAMSRDGSEGWAVGWDPNQQSPKTKATTLFHWNGTRWTSCDPLGVKGVTPPDPACSELAGFVNYTNGVHAFHPVMLQTLARVPLENDSDPTNDDEFELYAAGTVYRTNPSEPERFVIAVYRDGRWQLDTQAMTTIYPDANGAQGGDSVHGIAFAAPDDGWLVTHFGHLFHFDGRTWVSCGSNPAACGDDPAQPRVPGQFGTAGDPLDLTVAGSRVYLFGQRLPDAGGTAGALGSLSQQSSFPIILYKDPGGQWTDGASTDGGGYDPGCTSFNGSTCVATSDSSQQGDVKSLSVAEDAGGGYHGWAAGTFGAGISSRPLLRLAPEEDSRPTAWTPWTVDDASADYAPRISGATQVVTVPGAGSAGGRAFILATNYGSIFPAEAPLLSFDPARGRWEPQPTPFGLGPYHSSHDNEVALPQAIAADNRGGLWLSIRRMGGDGFGRGVKAASNWFYRYTDEVPRPLFEDVRSPVIDGTRITSAAGSPDGSFWLTTTSGTVYRYDRISGWDRVSIPRWDPGRVVTRPSSALAVAAGPDGDGIVVGEGGRIADISPSSVQLDRAAGAALCSAGNAPPCGTSRDLDAAAVSPQDGSAMVGGADRALLWRQPGGDFQAITPPDTAPGATITGISLPTPQQAYLTTDQGEIFDGNLSGGDWVWTLGDERSGALLSANATGDPPQLNAIAVDGSGEGFAVGNGGVILARSEGTWRRISQSLPLDDFHSVVLAANGTGRGALVGGTNGLVLTLTDGRFEVAHQGDPYSGVESSILDTVASKVVGLALLPGGSAGEAEAWAAEQLPPASANRSPQPNALLHYASDPSDPLLKPDSRGAPLPDVASPDPTGLSFAVFGKQDCSYTGSDPCPDQTGTNRFNEVVARRVADQIAAASDRPGGPSFTVFSGDATDAGGRERATAQQTDAKTAVPTPVEASVKHDDWVDQVAARFDSAGVPLLGAIGGQDLTGAKDCIPTVSCFDPTPSTGSNLPWRQSMASMPRPWGSGPDPSPGSVEFRPVADGATSVQGQDQTVSDPTGQAGDQTVPTGGARTHYAVDVVRDGEQVARLVFLDTSLKSLEAADPVQNPLEAGGGQLAWLQTALTRPPGEPAVVVSNAPTYSYGPGQTETDAADSAQLDSLYLQNHVSAVVSGRLGWNALYWTIGAGLHWPCPGGSYPAHPGPPSLAEVSGCSQAPAGTPSPEVPDLGGSAAAAGALPTVISSSAGGKFAQDAQQSGSASSSNGFWHGYSIVHLDPSGDPAKTIVEQRPVFDWIALGSDPRTRGTHMVRAGQKLRLMGYGREPAGIDTPLRYDEVSSPAITHRYDLLEADPAKPWLPRSGTRDDDCDPFDCLDPKIGTIDRQSGEVRAGNGTYPRTFAIAELSVGEQSATYPLAFEPRASFSPPRPVTVPPVAVPTPPPAAAPPPAQTPTAQLPAAPVLPVLSAQAPAPPPAPPAPPTFASQAPMDLSITPSAINVLPPTAVSQPPTPPVNPAPPSGARREARQRQAAAQKSGADSDSSEGSEEIQGSGGDLARGPDSPDQAMSRHDFTAIADRTQPSAWGRDLLLGGGLGAAALILALGLGTARPTPRRRQPEAPAPAWARQRRRG